MKNPIRKRILRQIIQSPGKTLPLFLAMVFIVTFSSSFFTSQDSAKHLYYKQLNEGAIEDGQFTTIFPLTEAAKNELEKKDIKLYESFYLELANTPDKTLKAYVNRKDINLPQILEGRLASGADEVAISANYARANKIKVGEKIALEGQEYLVTGLISLPDYSSLLAHRDDLVMDTGHFGTCLLAKKGFESFQDVPVRYTYVYHTKAPLDKKEGREKLKDLIQVVNQDNRIIDGVIQQDNHCITYLMDDMNGDVPMMITFMVILFVALAFISAVQVKSLIEREAPVIGTLLASGYTKKELWTTYMMTPTILAIVAGILGNIFAYLYAYQKYIALYYQSFDLPSFQARITLRSFLLTCIVPLLIYWAINGLIIAKSLRFKPLDFLRGRLSKEKKSKVKLSLPDFIMKYRIRVALDNKLNLASLLFGIILANVLLVYGLSVQPIFKQYTEEMKNNMPYHYSYFVKMEEKGLQAAEEGQGGGDLEVAKATILTVELVDRENKKVQIFGVDKGSAYKIPDWEGLKAGEVIVSKGVLERFSYKIGDEIKVREPFHTKDISLRIKDVDDATSQFQIYTRREYLNQMVEQDPDFMNAYLSNVKLKISKDNLLTLIDKENMTKFMEHFLEGFGPVFEMFFYIGIGFSIIVTVIVTNLIVDKARVNIGYLKIFGFHDREITKIYVQGILVLLIIFQFLMIPLINQLLIWLMYLAMTKFDAYVVVDIPLNTYFKALAVNVLIFILIQIFEKVRISRLDMVKELKMING